MSAALNPNRAAQAAADVYRAVRTGASDEQLTQAIMNVAIEGDAAALAKLERNLDRR